MPHPTSDSAYGIWSLNEIRDAVRGDNWPSVVAGFATLDPDRNSGLTLSNGNLTFSSDGSNRDTAMSTASLSSGKYYWELLVTEDRIIIGVEKEGHIPQPDKRTGQDTDGYSWRIDTSVIYHDSSSQGSYGSSVSSGDIVGVAFDVDAGTIEYFLNGVSQGQAFSGLTGTWVPSVSDSANVGPAEGTLNFGQNAFSYSPPSGFTAGVPAS